MFDTKISIVEIFILSIFFTFLAIYSNIHKEHHVLGFLLNHAIAILIAIIISKIVYNYF